MMACMNARSSQHGSTFGGDSRPLASAVGALNSPLLHLLDLVQFIPSGVGVWTDALKSETRRHLAGCLCGLQAALFGRLAGTDVAPALDGIADFSAWAGVQRHPQLIGPELIAHMRVRAAVGLLGRQSGVALDGLAAPVGEDLSWLHDDADPAIVRLAGALSLAEQRWATPGGEELPMRPDLPAEHFADLAWTVAALAGEALARAGAISWEAAMGVVADATIDVVARHDEGETPIAQAGMMARLLGGRPDAPVFLGQALAHRQILLFAALAGERADIAIEAILHALVHASPGRLAGLCHALGGSAADCRHLLIQLQPVRAGLDDATIFSLTSDYDSLAAAEANAAVAALRGPAELRTKLALVNPASGL